MTTFSQEDRLDKLPPLSEQYAIDDLLTEHFGFAPKVFTGHIFNIINEAIYDTVSAVEEAVIESYFPGTAECKANGQDPPTTSSTGYPTHDDIAKSLNQLETLLCSSIDNQFDLLEIWLHRNVFTFPTMRQAMMKHFRFKHLDVWDQLPALALSTTPDNQPPSSSEQARAPDWEKIKTEEEGHWKKLDKFKSDYQQSSDDYRSLLAVSDALDRKLAGLKAVSSQLTQISSEASIIYDATTNKPMDLATQSSKILARYRELVQLDETQEALHQKVNFAHPSPAGDEPLEEDQQHLGDRPDTQMAKYSRAINLLTQAKTHTFLAELADKAPVELEKDEGLVEVLNHLTSKGKSAAPNPPLQHDEL
ncbi:hypothetical protein PCANC_13097 [Puccinia coronata f. sp. avenae]|uniref:Uncharacterized protein n=1 Tax=Puccinia coronata f. sp. avenae TaxID=200324 RepID=A0A2N5TDR9_9BASI|nr:hypothetical protein PCASD_12392 [Puccinia coronata f. sp. avenae]PLW41514.1 hypothetical protein PCANC_13097 [Puccinia coronata f. sp. avenae]